MAYAALLSLSQTLDKILLHSQYLHPLDKKNMISLQRNVTTMLTFLDYSHTNEINLFESQIIDASYRVEDIIESKLSSIYLSLYKNKAQPQTILPSIYLSLPKLCFQKILSEIETRWGGLNKASRDIEYILKKVMNTCGNSSSEKSHQKINSIGRFFEYLRFYSIVICQYMFHPQVFAVLIRPQVEKIENDGPEGSDCTNTQVGFVNEYEAIKDMMYQRSSDFKIIPIVGMGGIGKTTLARRIYEDSIRMQYFDRCVWVVVSQEYSYKETLLGILRSIKKTDDDLSWNSVSKLVELIHKELFGRRYLLVLDDVWNEKTLDDLNRIMPKNDNGSCVLLTTRVSKVATYVTSTPVHELHLLSEEQSWILLNKTVFGTRSIPSELERIGKRIAKECGGLPLTIVVVAGLLKGNMAKEYWESISQNISSREPTIELRCSKVLSLSYDHLPSYLKPCFLYVAAFPEDYVINVNRLIRLWMAEGFVKSSGSKCLEETAGQYLDDLVGRSILQAVKRRYNGRIKTVGIHDLLRDVGTLKALEERFHYHGLLESFGTPNLLRDADILSDHRRLSIHTKESLDCLQYICNPTTRSLLIFLSRGHRSRIHISNFTMLRVLDALNTIQEINPGRLVHLRYLAFTIYNYDEYNVLESRFKLPNLQTLIIHGSLPSVVPLEIWTMPSLRHLILPDKSYLEQPISEYDAVEETKLVTLYVTSSLEMNTHTTKMLANLKKLGLYYSGVEEEDWENSQFSNIVHLGKLEELKLVFHIPRVILDISAIAPVELAFPLTLKKLSLNNTQRSWRDMSIVGSLPNLEVLKLRYMVFTDQEWDPIDGQFLKLKYLEFVRVPLHHWEADCSHFPSLEILFLQSMYGPLKEIPSGLGEIDTLRLIRLLSCRPSLVDSALQIQAQQQDMGNDDFQVIVSRFG